MLKKISLLSKYFFLREKTIEYYNNKFSAPKKLYIECTNVCNAECIFCYYPKCKDDIDSEVMDLGVFQSIVNEYVDSGGSELGLTPTMADPLTDNYFDDRCRIVDASPIKKLTFYTNLINFRKSFARALSEIDSTIVEMHVSITGFNRSDYNKYMGVDMFERVKRNIKLASNIDNDHVKLSVTLRKYQDCGEDFYNFCGYLNELCVKYEIVDEFDTWGGLVSFDDEIGEVLKFKKRIKRFGPCIHSYSKPVVKVNQELKLCDVRDGDDELVVGNIGSESLMDLWSSGKADKLRRSMFSVDEMPKVCSKCEHYRSIFFG